MQPKIGQTLYIHAHTADDDEENQVYRSRIADLDDATVAIDVPIHQETGALLRLHAGDFLQAYFLTDGGIRNVFETRVVGFRNEGAVRLVVIRRPKHGEVKRMQRRHFLRVNAELEVAVMADPLHFVAVTENVSGGGFAFICGSHYPLKVEQTVSCWLLIPYRSGQIDHVPFKAKIVRIHSLGKDQQKVMLKYVDIMEADQQKIVRFCFEKQMEQRKQTEGVADP